MTYEAFARALSACHLLPEIIVKSALRAGQGMDEKARIAFLNTLQQEYAQYVPLVQRKLERMESTIAEAEARQYSPRSTKNHAAEAAIVRQLNGLLS